MTRPTEEEIAREARRVLRRLASPRAALFQREADFAVARSAAAAAASRLALGAAFAAGEKLRRDYTLAQLAPRMGVDLTAPVVAQGGRGPDRETVSDIALAARQRFSRAMAAAGPGLSDLAFEVCCDLGSLERAEARRGWAKRSGRVVLTLALDRLAAYYGLTITLRRAPIRAWSLDEAG